MSAKEMFKKLGYKKNNEFKKINIISYYNEKLNWRIDFDNRFHCITGIYYNDDKEFERGYVIDMKELQAINKQVEELGWNER